MMFFGGFFFLFSVVLRLFVYGRAGSLQKIAVGNLESGYRSPQSKKSFGNHPRNSFSTSLGVLD